MSDRIRQNLLLDVTVFPQVCRNPEELYQLFKDVGRLIGFRPDTITDDFYSPDGNVVSAIGFENHIILHAYTEHDHVQIDILCDREFEVEPIVRMLRDNYELNKGHYAIVFRGVVPPMPDLVFSIEEASRDGE